MVKVGTIEYDAVIRTDKIKKGAADIDKTIKGTANATVSNLDKMGGKFQSTGATLTKTLTPAALAVGAVMFKAGADWKKGTNAIITGTGAAGDELKEMQGIMKGLAGRVPQDIGTIGEVVADLNTRLGLSGKELDVMSKKMLDLARVSGGEVKTTTAAVTRLFGDWGIATDKQAESMDKLFKASQLTGISVENLGQLMVQFGAPMRELGFTFDDTAALLSKFEKEGVNVELVMGGLKQGLGRLAKAGKEPRKEMFKLMENIRDAGLTAENKQRVFEIFGARAGIDMAKAMEEGRFAIDDLVEGLDNAGGSIDDAAERTLTLTDKLGMMKDSIMSNIGPFGEIGSVVAGAVAAIGPFIFGLGTLMKHFKDFKKFSIAGALFNPITLALAALAAIIVVVVKNWGTIKPVVDRVWAVMQAVGRLIWGLLKPAFDAMIAAVREAWGAIKPLWEQIQGPVMKVLKGLGIVILAVVVVPLGILVAAIVGVIYIGTKLITAIAKIITAFADMGKRIIRSVIEQYNSVRDNIGKIVNFFTGLPGKIVRAVGNLGGILYQKGRDMIQGLINGAGSLLRNIGRFFLDLLPGWIVGPFKKAMGISSPSKLFASYGKNMMQGLAGGVTKGTGLVDSAMGNINDRLNIDATASLGALGRTSPQPVYNIKIDVSGLAARSRIDLREIGKDIAEAIKEESRATGVNL